MDPLLQPLTTISGVVVLGVLMWWRIGRVEKEVMRLRDDRHAMANTVSSIEGAVDVLRGVTTEVLSTLIRR